MQTYEVEIKSLLGNPDRAEQVREAMEAVDPDCKLESKNKQLNHYFEPSTALGSGGGTLAKLADVISPHLSPVAEIKLEDLAARASDFSVRTRDKDGIVFFVVKASVGNDSSANGVSRIEFEEKLPLSLDELDELILSAGFKYQAKWSREREEYICNGINITLDKNAGYGWLAEFERVVDDESKVAAAREEIQSFMKKLGVVELPQDRLERMFAFYNKHWPEYYGTEKIFIVE
jgi:predicted adenylyl cyclase CyaB